MLNLIFCVDNNGLFGRKNILPWYFKEDLKYFREVTTNYNKNNDNVIVMGYNTWISLKKKLPNRINIVISNKLKIQNTNINNPDHIYNNFDDFIINCKKNYFFFNKNIFIIGGEKLLSYVILNYNIFIKNIFMNIIDYSFHQLSDDIIFKLIYDLEKFNITEISNNTIHCLNINDDNYYYIKCVKAINNNFNLNEVIKFTNDI